MKSRKISEVGEVVRGVTFDKSESIDSALDGYIPILRAGNITESGLKLENDIMWVPQSRISDNQMLKQNDVVICMASGSAKVLGKNAQLKQTWKGSVGAFCAIVRFSNGINSQFGAYWLKSSEFIHWRDSQEKGANIQNLRKSSLEELEIPIPSLPEQERIVRLLDEAESLRATRERANVRMEQFAPALFHEMFGDPVRNEKKWDKKVLMEFGAVVRYGLGQPPTISEEGIPMLRATNIKHGKISTDGLIYVHREDVPSGRNAFLEADEILVVRSGAYTGDIARVGEEWKGAVAGYDLVVNPGDMFNGEFLASYLLTNFVQKEYFSSMKQRAAQPHINAQQVGNTPVFCPPLALQREFAARVEEARGVQSAQGKSAGRVEALYQSMLARAFAGEL